MRIAGTFALVTSLALGCGGMVIVEGDGNTGGGGEGGDTGPTTTISGDPGKCAAIDCSGAGTYCSCITTCMGPDLRADCNLKSDGTIVCECHLDDGYLGLCANFGGDLCGLPSGCCLDYLPD